ncbi:MAG TPA: adenylate/guanylate cyclase domain-containing protein [Actinomycetota bacterium]|nr:adenylate/guanylate cyclase domain-containing protein [Actinomycetota bacterium]
MDELPCPTCGTPSPPDQRFCGACGASLERACPSCGQTWPPSFRFCGNCGTPLGSSTASEPASVAGVTPEERKVVSVIFADLSGSTELATRLDPEDLRGVLRPFFDAMVEEVERFGGTVEKFIGDAVMAVFGVPVAHEDDPERAVRAAFAMQGRMDALNQQVTERAGGDLDLRVGVNTGEVLAAHSSDREGYVTGEVVNVAARLQTVAAPGAVVVGRRTRDATLETIAYRDLGSVELKGIEEPVAVYEALPDRRPEEARRPDAPMVGRGDELDLLRLVIGRARKQAKPGLVTLVGPPGIGKSRLASESLQSLDVAGTEPVRVVRGRCLPYDGGPYRPMAEILKADAGILDSDAPSVIMDKARTRLTGRFAEDGSLGTSEVLLSAIGIDAGSDPLAGVEPAAAGRAIAGAWRRYFESLCADGPVVALIEDIHWADDPVFELIESLSTRTGGALVLLCTARTQLWELRPSWGAGVRDSTVIELPPLSDSEGRSLLEGLLGGGPPDDVVEQITARAGGNPFFTGELVRMMVEDRTLERVGDAWTRTRDLPSSLPDTVQRVIASRIDLLTSAQKRAIQDCAVVGRVCWVGAVERLGGSEVEAELEGLIDKGFVQERDASAIAGERELSFHHALTRDVAYESIPHGRRREAHGRVIDWLEQATTGRDEEFAEILANHASRADDHDRVARYAMLAGHRHRRVFAAEEAIAWYDRAVAALEELPAEEGALTLFEIALSRGEAYEQLGRFDEAHADYERALEAARARPEGSRGWLESRALAAMVHVLWKADRYDEGEALLPRALESARVMHADDLVARLLHTAGSMAIGRGDWEGAASLHHEALDVATEAGDREMEAFARHGLVETGFFTGRFGEALMQGRRADELLRALGQQPMLLHNGYMNAAVEWLLGDPIRAERIAEASAEGARDLGNRVDEAYARSTLGLIGVSVGELGAALGHADEAVEIASTVAAPRVELTTRLWRLWPLSELGDHERFARDVERTRAIGDQVGGRFLRPPLEAAVGWVQARADRSADAEASFADAVRSAGDTPGELLLALRLEVACWEEREDGARLARAAGMLREAAADRSPLLAAWAAYAAALADLLAGDTDRVETGALRALEAATEVSEIPLVWRCHALLGRAHASLGRTDASDEATARAREILARIVAGLEDRPERASFVGRSDVAAVLSPRAGAAQA